MECYGKFAKIYDELINCDIDYKAWADFILDICAAESVSFEDYLDIACGTGNMAVQIGKSFKETWLVDISEEMLSEAESKLRNQGIKAKFIRQDITNLKLNKKFDLVTCCLDSTNYILNEKDLLRYFSNVREHLKEEGLFIFDINSYYKLKTIMGNNLYSYDDEKVTYIWENSFNNEITEMYLTFFVKEGDVYRRFDEQHKERAYEEKTIAEILERSGLQILHKFDGYENKKPEENTERIVYVTKKKGEIENG